MVDDTRNSAEERTDTQVTPDPLAVAGVLAGPPARWAGQPMPVTERGRLSRVVITGAGRAPGAAVPGARLRGAGRSGQERAGQERDRSVATPSPARSSSAAVRP